MYHISRNQYDVVLKKKEGIHGLDRKDVLQMLDLIGSEEFYPIEIFGLDEEASLMGFITKEAAEKVGYSYNDQDAHFSTFICDIVNEHEKYTEQKEFVFHGIKIWLS